MEVNMTLRKKIAFFALLFLLIAFSGFIAWANNALSPQDRAVDAMKGTQAVQVITEDGFLEFVPKGEAKKGVIIYPGGKVAPEAYAPIALEMAKEEFLTVIVPMPLNLAFLGSNRALKVIDKYPEIDSWAIAGHSLGGAMACQFVDDHPGAVEGLVLLAAYTIKRSDLSEVPIPVLSITASNDGLTTPEKIEKTKEFLPEDTIYIEIEGGNHAQFGDYGTQMGDGEADISGQEQIALIVTYPLNFLED